MPNDDQKTFDLNAYLDDLMTQMNMDKEEPEMQAKLKDGMATQLNHMMLNAVSLHLNPDEIDRVMGDQKENDDPLELIYALIQESEEAQVAIVQALEDFREQTLDTYKRISERDQ